MAGWRRKVPLWSHIFVNLTFKPRLPGRHMTSVVTGNLQTDKALNAVTGGRIGDWLQKYEDFVGLTEVKDAQDKVIQAENQFHAIQNERREKQHQLTGVQLKLKELASELDKFKRGEDKYLVLVTEETRVIKEENQLRFQLEDYERREREHFATLSSAVRESHEKERARAERTKYWSVIGSVIGAAIGILGTSINNYLRMRELRSLVKDSAQGGMEMKGLVTQLSDTMRNQHNQVQSFIVDLKTLTGSGALASNQQTLEAIRASEKPNLSDSALKAHTTQILNKIREQDEQMSHDMADIRKILASSRAAEQEESVVYVGPEVGQLLESTERNLEWKMKMNALWTTTLIYGAFALTLPVLYGIFKGT